MTPPLAQTLTKPQLELRVLHAVGPIFYCDPDEFPVGRGTPAGNAERGFRNVDRDPQALSAILMDLHLTAARRYPLAVKERIWALYKRMNGLGLEPTPGGYRFSIIPTSPTGRPNPDKERQGFVSKTGAVYLGSPHRERNFAGCPICLVRGTLISTPDGPVAVDRLHVGDPIWTADVSGHPAAVHVERVGRVPVGPTHAVIDLQLRDGRRLTASPGHPLANGQRLMDLRVGAHYDGSVVAATRWAAYTDGWTYDVLPQGPTGEYWADGVLVASTLTPDQPGS